MARNLKLGIMSVLSAILLITVAGCGSTAVSSKPPATKAVDQTMPSTSGGKVTPMASHVLITITDKGYSPATVTVKVNGTVVWINKGKYNHTVMPDNGGPSSGAIKPGVSAVHTFKASGTFAYHDGLFPKMKGIIYIQ